MVQHVVIKKSLSLVLAFTFFFSSPVFAAWVWSPEEGKFINPDEKVQESPQEQFDYAMEFYKSKDLKQASHQLRLLLKRYPGSQIAPEAQYRLGTIFEEQGDYQRAFESYRDLLQRYPQTERMTEAVEREFKIGNLFLSGRKAKLMGLEVLPSGPRAVEVFKHVAEAAPYSEYGDKAQFHLGLAYKKINHFQEAVEAFQKMIDLYPQSEMVPQARFQIADTSYLESVVSSRDQRVIDQAEEHLDKFLDRYPDSSVSDKAARLRQEIDEKNAEKNFRIGFFYEKENFLDSAFIYYRDVAERYPHTQSGKQAIERLRRLERPMDYLKSQEAEVGGKKQKLVEEIKQVGDSDPARKKDLEWELKRTEKEEKEVRKAKPETIKRRLAALRMKEKSLKEKRRALKKKKKHFTKNSSEDLVLAFQRWEASLAQEEQELVREKMQIDQWEKNLGVQTEPFFADWVPFGKEPPTPLQQVQRVEAKRLDEINHKKRELLLKKESLYHEHEKLLALGGLAGKSEAAFETEREKLETQASEIRDLEKKLKDKETLYQKYFGTPAWQAVFRVPTKVLGKSVEVINPFEGEERKDWKSKSPEELKAMETEWQKKVAAQKELIDVIGRAFDDELARVEEKRRLVVQPGTKKVDAKSLRKEIKHVERQIRTYYNEIQDRNNRKDELLSEVERALKGREKQSAGTRAGKVLTAPARGAYLFGKSFLFGLPERDVELTEEAKRRTVEESEAALLNELREQIELESLLIETRNREILRMKREVEALRAQASLAGTGPVKPVLVKIPYVFVREAIVSANRLVPKKDRKEKLIAQLNRETEKMEKLKLDLAEIKSLRANPRSGQAAPSKSVSETQSKKETREAEPAANQQALAEEIRTLQKQLELRISDYEAGRESFEKARWEKLSPARDKARTGKLRDLEEDLVRLIEEEQKIQEEEQALLAKKKEVVNQLLQKVPADLFGKELGREREQIDSRLNEIQKRQSSLGEELRRFRPQAL